MKTKIEVKSATVKGWVGGHLVVKCDQTSLFLHYSLLPESHDLQPGTMVSLKFAGKYLINVTEVLSETDIGRNIIPFKRK